MTQNLKIEVLTGDISIDGMVVTNLVTKEELSTAIVKKADLGTDGKIPTSQLPAEIVNTAGIVDEVKLQLETSIKDAVDESNAYAESYTDNALTSKADLESGKVPLEQLPSIDQYPQFGTSLTNLSTTIMKDVRARTDELEKTKASLGEDGKVLRELIPSYEKISGLPEQLEVMSAQTAAVSKDLVAHKGQTADQIDTLKENIEANVQQLTNRQSHLMRTYATKELGVDAKVGVKPGEYFYVRSANEKEMMVEYQNVGGAPTPTEKSYPSGAALAEVKQAIIDPITGEATTSKLKDKSGKWQQEINFSLLAKSTGFISVLEKGAQPRIDFDSADAFQETIDATEEGWTLLIPPGKYYLSKDVTIPENINIMCCGELLLHHTAHILITRSHVLEVSGTAFSALPKKGDSKLNFTTAPELEYPSNHFAVFSSTEDEITRIGSGYYTPYTKRECLDVISQDFKLRAPVKLTYTNASALTVRFYKRAPKVTVSGLRIKVKPEVGITNKPNLLYIYGASDIEFVDCHIDRLDTNWTGINIRIFNCCGISFRNTSVYGANSAASGDSYAFLLETSTFVDFYKCAYKDGNNIARSERGYAGRHGSNITFDKCEFAGIDDHYGHDYTIENMTFNGRGASIAGGSLTLNNCHAIGSTGILVTLRNDTPFADGELILNNCSSEYLVLSSQRASDARSTKRKVWDRIVFNNVVCGNAVSGYAAVLMTGFLPTDERQKTKEFIVRDSKHTRKTPAIGSCFFFGSTAADDGGTKFRWVESVKFFNTEFKNEVAGNGSFQQKYVSLLRLNADKIGFYNCSGIASSDIDCDELTIGSDSKIGNLDAYGLNVTDNTRILNIFNSEVSAFIILAGTNNTTEVSLVGDLIKSPIFSGGLKLPQNIVFMSGNRAPVGTNLSGAPGSIMSYVNPTKYLAGTNAVSYDPPSLAIGAQQSSIVDLAGAAVGDNVLVSFSLPLQGTQMWGEVTSANKVTVYHRNGTGSIVDLSSGTLTVKLI